MQRVTVGLEGRPYEILIGEGLLERLAELIAPIAPSSVFVVTNPTVEALYGERVRRALRDAAPLATVVVGDGETHKVWPAVATVLDALVAARADRKSLVVALGGGVVGDLAGFAAAVYMRGIRFVQVPTTLLAQVDSSVGGKTGINHQHGKNLIGAFHQPSIVVSDICSLKSLPPREVSAGLAEVLKHGLIADADYFEKTSAELASLRALDSLALSSAIARSCEIKSAIVGRDERESGERALLNFGHTFGHAIEAMTGYGSWLHGEAVGCGMALAADLSRRAGLLDAAAIAKVERSIAAAGLPTRIEGLSLEATISAMRGDKKAQGGRIGFVLLERIGRAVQRPVPDELLRETLRAGGFR